ncbi:calcium-binding protein [Pelagibacterium sp.]|uniref:calcium-binding protein n=1 Tax=Pelagibacterium sp. TaxID=1967288 RepID=UPI003A93479B
MSTVTYLKSVTSGVYSDEAFGYIAAMTEHILEASEILSISAGAIAGAMIEENHAYGAEDALLDWYAVSNIASSANREAFREAYDHGPSEAEAWLVANTDVATPFRTHEQWKADFETVQADAKPSRLDKILHPSLIDVGPANFKIATAIGLVIEYANKYPALGLGVYLRDYGLLVADLIDKNNPLTAKLYGLYLKEGAERFFLENGAYEGQWESLPQTLRDALLITYTNRGEQNMLDSKKALYDDKELPYEPQPGLTASGGMNHLENAAALGSVLGLDGYGEDAIGVKDFAAQAMSQDGSGLAHRYALYHLRYVAINGLDFSRQNVSGELNLYDPQTGQGVLTAEWIADRAAMMSWLVKDTSLRDRQQITDALATDGVDFQDLASGQEVIVLPVPVVSFMPIVHRVYFGGDGTDAISGNKGNDRLYGGGGTDTIKGEAGIDYLEGGSGSDQLDGGADNDTLLGGKGDDVLIGGAGNDILKGGLDIDTYQFEGDFGYDTIQDIDGKGGIEIDGITLTGGENVSEGVYRDMVTGWTYTLADNDLLIHKGSNAIRIEGWHSERNLGIRLGNDEEPAADNTITGDFIKQLDGAHYITTNTGYASAGAQADTDDVLLGGSDADSIVAGGGNDGVLGGAGDDAIDGGSGDDLLMGGQGADRISGGDGIDYIFGSVGGYLERPVESGFSPVNASGPELTRGFNWVVYQGAKAQVIKGYGASRLTTVAQDEGNFLAGGAGNDHIDAGNGDDTVHGNQDNDTISGMAGDDLLFGDEGNDTIYGDGVRIAEYFAYTPLERDGDDLLFGGEGNDYLVGQGGRDRVFGGQGEDILLGDERWDESSGQTPVSLLNDDYLDGGDDDDYLEGGGGDDILIGGTGNDDLWGDAPADFLSGASHGRDTLDGGAGNDTLWGGADKDLLRGGDGADFLHGDDNDLPGIYHADDRLEGGEGEDGLWGDGGNDILIGGSGNDWLAGEDQTNTSDITSTLVGDDYLDGGDGDDVLIGGNGNDTLVGGTGDDLLLGGDGNDILLSGPGCDTLLGGLGDDNYTVGQSYVAPNEIVVVQDQGGTDVLVVDGELTESDQLFNQGDLVLSFGNTVGARLIQIKEGLRGSIEQIKIGQGPTLSFKEWVAKKVSSSVALASSKAGDTLFAGTGADVFTLSHSGVAVETGGGNDTIKIASSSISGIIASFNEGDGVDLISGTVSSLSLPSRQANIARFGEGVDSASLQLIATRGTSTEASLYVSYGRGDDMFKITLSSNSSGAILRPFDLFEFADGSSLTWEQLADRGVIYDASIASSTTAVGTLLGDNITGSVSADIIKGGNGNDVIDGGAGNDTLSGNNGADTYIFGRESGSDTISNSDSDALGVNPDTIELKAGVTPDEVLFERSGNNLILKISGAPDRLTITNYFSADATTSSAVERIVFEDGTELDIKAIKDRLIVPTSSDDLITGYATADFLRGEHGNDQLYGAAGDDTLVGDSGDDLLSGDDGNDLLIGGSGDDELRGGKGNDIFRFARGFGTDTIDAYEDTATKFDVIDFSDILSSEIIVSREGSSLILSVQATNDSITVISYFATESNQRSKVQNIKFADGVVWGVEDVLAASLVATDGNDKLYGFSADETIYGGGGNDHIDGGAGNDILEGGAGDDILRGGLGNDIYRFYRGFGNDTISSNDGPSTKSDTILFADITADEVTVSRRSNDLLLSSASGDSLLVVGYFTSEASTLRKVEFIRFSDDIVWSVSDVKQRSLIGTSGDDSLLGFATDDTVFGGAGNDRIEGLAGKDLLLGGDGNDTIYGSGNDTIDGGLGDDVFYNYDSSAKIFRFERGDGVDVIKEGYGDVSIEFGASVKPEDVIISRFGYPRQDSLVLTIKDGDGVLLNEITLYSYFKGKYGIGEITYRDGTVWDEGYIRNSLLIGSDKTDSIVGYESDDSISGGAGNDTLEGLAGNDYLDGGTGVDRMMGGEGNDTLAAGEGDDFVWGDSGADHLSGANGNDRLNGGHGSDTYWIQIGDGNDTISEEYDGTSGDIDVVSYGPGIALTDLSFHRAFDPSNGSHLVIHNVKDNSELIVSDFFYSNSRRVEILRFEDGTSADLDYILSKLQYGEQDTLYGTAGDDTYMVDNEQDIIVESANPSIDTVISSRTYTLSDNLENLTLTGFLSLDGVGNNLNNYVVGNSGDNVLRGKEGNDTGVGGSGDDIYYDFETVIESHGEGIDTWYAFYGGVLPDNVEIGYLGNGTGIYYGQSITLIGNELDNVLYSRNNGTQNDRLDGGLGADTMVARGRDSVIFYVDNPGDVVVASAYGNRYDSVRSTIDYRLGDYIENLTMTGSQAISGTGNGLDNTIDSTSSAANNVLVGMGGNDNLRSNFGADSLDGGTGDDRLRGGIGNDYLIGGDGSDIYHFAAGDGQDKIDNLSSAATDNDILVIEGRAHSELWLSRQGNDLIIDLEGSDDSLTVLDWYANASQQLDSIQAAGSTLYATEVDNLVNAMAAFGAPVGGEISLNQSQRDQVNAVIAANWQ